MAVFTAIGALAGAAIGATVGSAVIGTVGAAVVGAVVGGVGRAGVDRGIEDPKTAAAATADAGTITEHHTTVTHTATAV